MSEVSGKDSMLHGEGNPEELANKLLFATANFPHYSSYEDRLSSYDSWSSTMKQEPQVLSEAGFFYLGHDDRTVCFHCGGGLNEWKKYDDPWVEHAYWFPRCQFILSIKGSDFVNNAGSKKQEMDMLQRKKRMEVKSCENLIDTKYFKKTNTLNKVDDNHLNSSKVEAGVESAMLCKICFLYEKNILYLPCRHIVACDNCSSGISKCPVCRLPILDSMKVYNS